MKLEQQVCSLELAKRLKELGAKQESVFVWSLDVVNGWRLVLREIQEPDVGPNDPAAFTVAELGVALPFGFKSFVGSSDGTGGGATWATEWHGDEEWSYQQEKFASTEADARAKMLIHLIEKALVKP